MVEATPIPPHARVLLTGATGFLGRHVLDQLLRQGYRVRCLVRSPEKLPPNVAVTPIVGDITQAESVSRAAAGCQAVIHLVGMIAQSPGARYDDVHRLGAQNVVRACASQGIRRLVHVSALGACPGAPAPYLRSKWDGEQEVRNSSLAYTILRPSVIHGPGGAFAQLLVRFARFPWLIPVPACEEGLLQPVFVQDVARLAVQALSLPHTAGQTYDVAGPTVCTLEELLQAVSAAVNGRERRTVRIPLVVLMMLARLLETLMRHPPFTREQLGLLSEINVCSIAPLFRDFRLRPQGLDQSLRSYLPPRPSM